MSIGLNDLDKEIAARFRDYVRQLWVMGFEQHHHPHAEERDLRLRARNLIQGSSADAISPTAIRWITSIGIGLVSGALCASGGGEWIAAGIAVGPALGSLTYGLMWWNDRAINMTTLDSAIKAEQFKAVLALLKLDVAEQRYCELIAQILSLESGASRNALAEIIPDLSTLLGQSRELSEQRNRLLTALAGENATEVEGDVLRLSSRLAETEDPVARSAIQQSLEMLDERVANARALKPSLERIEAQQEVILQTFASVQSNIARMNAAPTPIEIPDLQDIKDSVLQVKDQTRALESAVQEVMQVTAGT